MSRENTHWSLSSSLAVLLSLTALACGVARDNGSGFDAGNPAQAVEELLRADRTYATSAASTNLVEGLGAMFDDSVAMFGGPAGRSQTRAEAVATLRTNAANLTSSATWTPIRGGISADGRHGFTQGYIATRLANGDSVPGKYLAYWVKRSSEWKVAVYKRAPRAPGAVSTAMLAPSLPDPGFSIGNAARRREFADEIRNAEASFSDEAGVVGTPEAFRRWGAPDAVNLGYGPEWVQGNVAIGAAQPPPDGRRISWSSDTVIVAATGDLGVSMGRITITPAPSGGTIAPTRIVHFFTIWKRASPSAPWRYVAE